MIGALEERFYRNFEERGELGASLSIWKDGGEVVSLHHGWADPRKEIPWTPNTLAPVWSATKGPAAITFLLALENAGLSPHDPVAKVWPELLAAREGNLTFTQLVSHQAGLPALSPENRPHLLSHGEVIAAMERQKPFWSPGEGHGYHPRTIGFLLDEIVRRIAGGMPLGRYWNTHLALPLRIDFWIGDFPSHILERLATMVPPKGQRPSDEELPFYRALAQPDSLALAAFASPSGMRSLGEINQLEYLQAGLPAFGGIGSAHALAKFYQILAQDGVLEGVQVIPARVLHTARAIQTSGHDQTLLLQTSFTGGFKNDPLDGGGRKQRALFGPSLTAFGQPGAGGSHAFADPESGYSFAYVMNQMEGGILPNRKSLDLVDQLYARS
ncbi:MAG: serine hydrolase [Verrucomicrobiales bacterium]|nr:serine hydrolase [Verrucomicrobiales bacterium]